MAAALPLLLAGLLRQAGGAGQGGDADDRYLAAALEAARWLEHLALVTEHGKTWPVQLEGEPRTSLALYDGAPGVVLFFLEAYHRTGKEELLAEARAGTDELAARLGAEEDLEPGLYTGLAGLGFTFCEAWKATGSDRYRVAAGGVLARLETGAIEEGAGVHWNGVNDVIAGSAGIGLFLLYAGRELDAPEATSLARRAGDRLIELGIPEHGGSKWAMTAEYPKLMPNFSHGTAGVGYFLVQLYRATGERTYLEAAQRAASYLRAIATPQEAGGSLIFHSEPGNEGLFYLSWCHGPAGTVRFLRALEAETDDALPASTGRSLVRGLVASGIPARAPGFWNNVGPCCGDAGVADFLQAIAALDGGAEEAELAERLLETILTRSTVDELGRRWTHAEHRVRPEELSTQTGYMQGAAGIAMVLLRADARAHGRSISIHLPDEPWPDLGRRGKPAPGARPR